jgi:23S rRNA (guanosine2251-2'-O)-methyltransferase
MAMGERPARRGGEADEGSTWIVGYQAVLAALEGGRPIGLLWLQQGRRDRRVHRLVELARSRAVATRFVSRARLDECAGSVPHNGCAARCEPFPLLAVEDLIAAAGVAARLLLLDSVTDPHNLGAVIRTAAAFAVDGVVVAGVSAPPLGGAVAKAAAGQLERVRLARDQVAADALAALRDAGYWVLGADAAGQPVGSVRPVDRWVLCVGAEKRGLRAKTRHQVDEWVRIPMAPGVESLNLSVATGILLYELCARWPAPGMPR